MSLTYSFNGTSLATQNIYSDGVFAPWHSTTGSSRDYVGTPGRVRGYLSRVDAVAMRSFDLPLRVNAFTLSGRQTALDWLKYFYRQTVTFRADDGTTAREIIARVANVQMTPIGLPMTTVCAGTVTMQAEDSSWRAISDTVISGIGATPVTVALGTAPTEDWSLAVTGFTSNLTVTLAGPFAGVMTYTASMAAGHALTISADSYSVLDNATDVRTHWAGGYLALDPMGSATPLTIALTASAGTPAGTLTYRKRYY